MNEPGFIKGFSKLSQEEKISLVSNSVSSPESFVRELKSLHHPDPGVQEKLNSFSENTLSNFPFPFGVAPNFLINGKTYIVPMVIEESSVVAAASAAARFWYDRGGFHAQVNETVKVGQVHFKWFSKADKLRAEFPELKQAIITGTNHITEKMQSRGGGILDIELIDLIQQLPHTYQLRFKFNTADSMGANFINSVLEESAIIMQNFFRSTEHEDENPLEIIMSILSNYTPECLVKVRAVCNLAELDNAFENFSGKDFSRRFIEAVNIAREDVYRAVTHNKGIYNGIDAVVLATGNDFRAAEAAGHAYASRDGKYRSLSSAYLQGDDFVHELEIPLALGTVGGLTALHPLARWAFEILGKPGSRELMMIAGAAGLASNFAAVRSLVTTGIQKGHMKMHLENILSFLNATPEEKVRARNEFQQRTISHSEIEKFLSMIRSEK